MQIIYLHIVPFAKLVVEEFKIVWQIKNLNP